MSISPIHVHIVLCLLYVKLTNNFRDSIRLDMTLSVVDILEGAKEREEFIFAFDGARDVWEEDIELYAPGYLQMEAEGNGPDYDHSRLIDPFEASNIRQRMYQEEINSGR